eukprot:3913764-Karenia_brevis.AAC.1
MAVTVLLNPIAAIAQYINEPTWHVILVRAELVMPLDQVEGELKVHRRDIRAQPGTSVGQQ